MSIISLSAKVAAVAFAATALTAVPAHAAPGDAIDASGVLTPEAALTALTAALNAARTQNMQVSIAIVSRTGALIAFARTEGAGPASPESARRKAFTSAHFGGPSGAFAAGATGPAPNISQIPGTLFLAGGLPIRASSGTPAYPVAAIGVGGAPQATIDESIAQAGLTAITPDL
ncbi:heme-binding protein [Actinocorallia lasiicapitis]